ncbi:transglutaminase TgpA family protein [Arenimonas caeni]|jgi:transglutaminase-like putative cysteine protease|uniref:DUF3488 domain-containing protein n=1 Tax=Arenimonas caeni TaxID=2058085 RepID=A0A2P6M796_9GAMM|nr:DUF3488 and transglutaminase-like domain-containing protein [Arenimonas caeni]MDY0021303.1 DUF3488 and transglutaminase-like domain-containing protein [Arenimonas caeni]PRH81866.1 DUF3488 domain-containing protein [Arenimonas caeni]
MPERLPTPLRRWCMAAAAACLLPLLLQVPAPLALALGATAALGYGFDRRWPGALRMVLLLGVAAYIVFTFGFNLGRDTGTALLAALLAVKPGETQNRRDAQSLLGFSLFAPFAAFLQDQGPLVMALSLLALALLLPALAMLAEYRPGQPAPAFDRSRLRGTGMAVLVALPLALAGFWLFPRLATPLWGMPENALGRGGLDDRMTPDQWIDLFSSDLPAARVRFAGTPPSRQDMYWRAQVLWDFDGRSWTRERRPLGEAAAPVPGPGGVVEYELSLEPTDQRYLLVLDRPLEAPAGTRLRADASVVSDIPVSRLIKYTGRSDPDARLQAALGPGDWLRATALPPDLNPRTLALGRQWSAESGGSDVAVVRRALEWIGAEFSYSLTVPPTGLHGVDEFLFDSKVGFCQHFSSAFAVLMRAAGIPSRVVIGYAGGYRNPYADYWVVRRMDAHAWTEVWLEGRGWTRVDPTAAVAPIRILDTVEDRQRAESLLPEAFTPVRDLADWARRGWNDLVLAFDADRQARLFRPLGVDQASAGQLGLAFAIGAGTVMLLTLWYLMRGQPASRDPLVAAWFVFTKRMRRAGLGKPAWEPPLAYGRRLSEALPAQSEALESLSRRYAAGRYAPDGLSGDELGRLVADLRAFRPTRTPRRNGDLP